VDRTDMIREKPGTPPSWSPAEQELALGLVGHLQTIAVDIGERNYRKYRKLCAAAEYVESVMRSQGHAPSIQEYDVMRKRYRNISVEIEGTKRKGEIIQVGAHYDTVSGSPGADDNGSAVAVLLELPRMIKGLALERTVRLTAFVNEESPFSFTSDMGSMVFARACRRRGEDIRAMLSLECLGFYRDEPGSQRLPFLLRHVYPDQGNFIAFVGNIRAHGLVRRCVRSFRSEVRFPCEGAALPAIIPGVSWSDHWSFWRNGYRAVMVTDTAFYRNPNYHTAGDLPETLDPLRTARVAFGLTGVIRDLAIAGERGNAISPKGV
jgi:Zn-dependent M28 family amino/carboxypeptidase